MPDRLNQQLRDAVLEDTPLRPPDSSVQLIRVAAAARLGEDAGSEIADDTVEREPASLVRSASKWLAVAAAAVVVVGIFVGGLVAGRATAPGTDFADQVETEGIVEYSGPMTGPAGNAANLEVVRTGIGRLITLTTDDLEILPTGEYYEIWFVGPEDTADSPQRVSAGTFHPDEFGVSNVIFSGAVDPAKLPVVEITAEPGDGDPTAESTVVLRAEIAPPPG